MDFKPREEEPAALLDQRVGLGVEFGGVGTEAAFGWLSKSDGGGT